MNWVILFHDRRTEPEDTTTRIINKSMVKWNSTICVLPVDLLRPFIRHNSVGPMEEFKVYLCDRAPGMAHNWRKKDAFGDDKFKGIIEVSSLQEGGRGWRLAVVKHTQSSRPVPN